MESEMRRGFTAGAAALALAALGAALVAGCGSGAAGGATVRLTPPSKGSTSVAAKVGDTIVLSFEANPSTGYEWTFTPGETFTIESSKYVSDPNPDNLVGKGGMQVVTLTVTKAGTSDLSGVYARSWETPKGGHVTPDTVVTVKSAD